MKQIRPLSDAEHKTLEQAYRYHPTFRVSQRAHALLLNRRGYSMSTLCKLFEVQHETVSRWCERWETEGITGLFDQERSGRPTTLNETEARQFIGRVDRNPHQINLAHAQLQQETGKVVSRDTLKRLLKKQLSV